VGPALIKVSSFSFFCANTCAPFLVLPISVIR
jgi:hypothetical protein